MVKLRFVLLLSQEHDYFFWLYITYASAQVRSVRARAPTWMPAGTKKVQRYTTGLPPRLHV